MLVINIIMVEICIGQTCCASNVWYDTFAACNHSILVEQMMGTMSLGLTWLCIQKCVWSHSAVKKS